MSAPNSSSLQLRIASVFVLLALAFSIGSYVALQWMVLPAFTHLEKEEAREDITRVKQLLQTELQAIANLAKRYSMSSDVADFLRGDAPLYPELNIHTSTWRDVDVELMLFFQRSGNLVWGKIVEPETGQVISVHKNNMALSSRGRAFVQRNRKLGDVRGIVEGERGIVLVAMQPVHETDGSGAEAGYFLIGRYLTTARREAFSERIGVDFSLVPVKQEDPMGFPTLPGATARYLPSHPVEYLYKSETIVSEQRLRDVFDQYTLELETRTPRMITNMGSGIQQLSFAFLTIMSSLFVLLTWLSIRWLVVEPIKTLKMHMAVIRRTGDLSLATDLGRNDELGELAQEFAFMQNALGEAHLSLENARDEALLTARRKSEFLASMSHEIRTPMNGVVGMTELLLRTELNQAQHQLVDTIKTSSSALVNVVNDVLDFSQIGSGKIQLNEKLFSVSSLVRDVNAVVAESAHRKGLEYITVEQDEISGGIVADDRRIRQILINLIGNAIKFTSAGQVVLSISCERTWWEAEKELAILKFNVADTGPGISPSQQEKLLAEFGRLDKSSTREFPGVGLGLAISKYLVELMRGDIGFESSEGHGSEFWFTLPVQLKRSANLVDLGVEETGSPLKSKKILIVDDNATNCEVLLSHASGWGAISLAVYSGEEALCVLEQEASNGGGYDVLILDSHMPGMSGFELAEAISTGEQFGAPLIVMLSSMTQMKSQGDLAAVGISCYLAKPVLRDDLFLQIVRALTEKPLTKSNKNYLVEPIRQQGWKVKFDAHVLVAEDNPVNQQLIEMVLQNFGCRCVLVDNGEKVLEKLNETTFDLVIMDCQMPVMDGFEATRKIRDKAVLSYSGAPIPILALTANAMEGDRDRCFEVGMDGYVSKPFSSDALGEAIEKLLGTDMSSESGSNNSSSAVAIDSESLDRVRQMQREGQPDILTRLIDVYLNSSPDLIEKLEKASAENDLGAIELSAHTLKSSSANLGALDFSSLCAEVEAAARAGGAVDLAAQCQAVVSEFDAVCAALRKERKDD
ncbi:MAG: response regulator [Halioglobus sp.]